MDTAFSALKEELCSSRVLVPFDPSKPIILATDASLCGITAILSHRFPDKTERPIAYFSRVLTPTEQRYSQIDKEALAIKTGVEKFYYYLFSHRFTMITVSSNLLVSQRLATAVGNAHAALLHLSYGLRFRHRISGKNMGMLMRCPDFL